jgi:hypothetical protein
VYVGCFLGLLFVPLGAHYYGFDTLCVDHCMCVLSPSFTLSLDCCCSTIVVSDNIMRRKLYMFFVVTAVGVITCSVPDSVVISYTIVGI